MVFSNLSQFKKTAISSLCLFSVVVTPYSYAASSFVAQGSHSSYSTSIGTTSSSSSSSSSTTGTASSNGSTTTSSDSTSGAADSCNDVNQTISRVFAERANAALPQDANDTVFKAVENSKAMEVNSQPNVKISIRDFFTTSYSSIFAKIKEIASKMIDSMWESVKNMLRNAYQSALNAMQNQINALYMNQVMRLASKMGPYAGSAFTQAVSGLVPDFRNAAAACQANLSQCGSAAMDNLTAQVVNNTAQTVTNLTNAAENTVNYQIQQTVNKMESSINTQINNASSKVNSTINNAVK